MDAAKAQIALNLDSDRFRMQAADAAVGVYKEMVVGALGALNSIASLSEWGPPVGFDACMTPRKNRTNAIQRVCHVRLQTTTRTG